MTLSQSNRRRLDATRSEGIRPSAAHRLMVSGERPSRAASSRPESRLVLMSRWRDMRAVWKAPSGTGRNWSGTAF
jgi:hypothetical protein